MDKARIRKAATPLVALAAACVMAAGCLGANENVGPTGNTEQSERAHKAEEQAKVKLAANKIEEKPADPSMEACQREVDLIEREAKQFAGDPAEAEPMDTVGINMIDDASALKLLAIQSMRMCADHGKAYVKKFDESVVDDMAGETNDPTAPLPKDSEGDVMSVQDYYYEAGYSASWAETLAYGAILRYRAGEGPLPGGEE